MDSEGEYVPPIANYLRPLHCKFTVGHSLHTLYVNIRECGFFCWSHNRGVDVAPWRFVREQKKMKINAEKKVPCQ